MELCDNWITAADVDACGVDTSNYAAQLVTDSLAAASEWAFHASGRRWPGTCTTTERPCGCGCGCATFGTPWIGPWSDYDAWTHYYHGLGSPDFGLCHCTSQSTLSLTYGPVIGTPTVTIAGAGFAGFTVIPPNRLMRTDGDAWPTCQDYTSASTGMLVEYDHGASPPQLGVFAAADIAAEVLKACSNQACALPAGTVNVTRRNISINLEPDQAARALGRVAMFLSAYPTQTTRPDVRRPGKRGLVTSGPA